MTLDTAGPTSRVYFSQRLRLHYVDWGNPAAPPLLLLHGGRDHCRNWDWVAAGLRDQYHIIAPDLRGHGDSAWSASGHYTMANYIYDLAQLVHQGRSDRGGLRFGEARSTRIGEIAERQELQAMTVRADLTVDLKAALQLRLIIDTERAGERPRLPRRRVLCRSHLHAED